VADPRLWGLVLAGGHSRRFGRDKALLQTGGGSWLERTVRLLQARCPRVFVSARPDQADDPERARFDLILDRSPGLGPAGGLLAAHQAYPGVAWLAVACDLPALDDATLAALCAARNARLAGVACRSPADGGPEPLCAIYEPATLARLRDRVDSDGHASPRDLLVAEGVPLVELPDPLALLNVNAPDDLRRLPDEDICS
jgi:molybdopterin-guanine dinucleotide biosynthesis protein A